MSHLKYLLVAVNHALILLLLGSCSGGEDSNSKPPPVGPTYISGVAIDGPIKDGQVTTYEIINGRIGNALASSDPTPDNGNYSLTFTRVADSPEPILIELRGGSYIDEMSGEEIELTPDQPLRAYTTFETGQNITVNLNAITHLSSCLTQQLFENMDEGSRDFRKAIATADQSIVGLFNIPSFKSADVSNVIETPPADQTLSPDYKYGYLLAGLSGIAHHFAQTSNDSDLSAYTSSNLIQLMCEDIRHDGKLNGIGDPSKAAMQFGSATMSEDFYREHWADGMVALVDRNINKAGFTREDIEEEANFLLANDHNLLAGEPSSRRYNVTRISSLGITDPGLLRCIEDTDNTFVFEMTELSCENYEITQLSGLTGLTELKNLNISGNLIEALDSNLPNKLIQLNAAGNLLTEVDISHDSLEHLILDGNPTINTISVNGIPNLKTLSIDLGYKDTDLNIVDISNNTFLESLTVTGENAISEVNVSENPRIKHLTIYCEECTDIIGLSSLQELETLVLQMPITASAVVPANHPNLKTLELSGFGVTALQNISSINLRENPLLERLTLRLPLASSTFNEIDISQNTNLLHFALRGGSIPRLDFNRQPNLEFLSIWASRGILQSLNISQNVNLKTLSLRNTTLESVDLSSVRGIEVLNFHQNESLSSLQLGNTNNLKSFYMNISSFMQDIQFSACDNLESFTYDRMFSSTLIGDDLADIELSGCPKLEQLHLEGPHIGSATLSDLPNVQELVITDTQIKTLNLSSMINLDSVAAFNNEIDTILLPTTANKITSLRLANNNLSSIDVSELTELISLSVSGNQLEELLLNSNRKIEGVGADRNRIHTLNIQNNPLITRLSLSGNQLQSLDVSHLGELSELYASNMETLTSLTLPIGSNIRRLRLENSHLSSLDFSRLLKLEYLDVTNNRLTELDFTVYDVLEAAPPLKSLKAGGNLIEDFFNSNFSICPNELDLSNNQLSSFGGYSCNTTSSFDLSCNQLTDLVNPSRTIIDNESLTTLTLHNNNFETLDLQWFPGVRHLNFANNPNLRTIDASKALRLTSINLTGTENFLGVIYPTEDEVIELIFDQEFECQATNRL